MLPYHSSHHGMAPSPPSGNSLENSFHDDDDDEDSPKKRQKVTRACDQCKQRKKKCSGEQPCAACARNKLSCSYLSAYTRGRPSDPSHHSHKSYDAVGLANPYADEPLRRPVADTNGSTPMSLPQPTTGAVFVPINSAHHQTLPSINAVHDTSSSTHLPPMNRRHSLASPEQPLPPPGQSFLQYVERKLDEYDAAREKQRPQPSPPTGGGVIKTYSNQSPFSFGDKNFTVADEEFVLPPKSLSQILVARYFDYVSPTYRFLHRKTAFEWVNSLYDPAPRTPPIRHAVALMVLASASLWTTDEEGNVHEAGLDGVQESERFFAEALKKMQEETGPPTLETAQARLIMVLHLLSTARPNRAWFQFGSAVQLIHALNMAHKQPAPPAGSAGYITYELRKRTLWAAYTLDKYLSILFRRPRLLQNDEIDQELPARVNDEDLTPTGVAPVLRRKDCLMLAPIHHAQLAILLTQTLREQAMAQLTERDRLNLAARRNKEIADWQAELPAFLSGAVHASSLIPVLQRQMSELRLGHAHAVLVANRHALLLHPGDPAHKLVELAINAAKDVLAHVAGAAQEGISGSDADSPPPHGFAREWFTQHVLFSALAVTYMYLCLTGRSQIRPVYYLPPDELAALAETGRAQLAEAVRGNGPAARYAVVLDGLARVWRSVQDQHRVARARQHRAQQQQQQQQQQRQRESPSIASEAPPNGIADGGPVVNGGGAYVDGVNDRTSPTTALASSVVPQKRRHGSGSGSESGGGVAAAAVGAVESPRQHVKHDEATPAVGAEDVAARASAAAAADAEDAAAAAAAAAAADDGGADDDDDDDDLAAAADVDFLLETPEFWAKLDGLALGYRGGLGY